MTKTKTLLAFLTLVACLGSFVLSYKPEIAFATSDDVQGRRAKFNCIYSYVHGHRDAQDVLIFGSSKAAPMTSVEILKILSDQHSPETDVQIKNLSMTDGDVSLSYDLLFHYLKNNPAPKVVYFEVLKVQEQSSVVPYINRAFSSVASWEVASALPSSSRGQGRFGLEWADFLRFSIDKQDKFLTSLMSQKIPLAVSSNNTCRDLEMAKYKRFRSNNAPQSLQQTLNLLDRRLNTEVERLSKLDAKKIDSRKKGRGKFRAEVKYAHMRKLGDNWKTRPAFDWKIDKPEGQRDLVYYRKLVELSQDYDFDLVFFRPYELLEPKVDSTQVELFESTVGADVLVPPFELAELAYPFYADPNHMGGMSKPVMSYWLAQDLIPRLWSQ